MGNDKKNYVVPIGKDSHTVIKSYCDENGLKISSFFRGFNDVMVQNYVLLVELQKKGKIINIDEDLLLGFSCIQEYIQFTQLDCLLYENFENRTQLTKQVGSANWKVLLELAKLGLETDTGKTIVRLNKIVDEGKG